MIVGIGTDLVEIRRMRDMMDRHRGLERIFTKNELAHAKDRADVLAGTFAVKRPFPKRLEPAFSVQNLMRLRCLEMKRARLMSG